MTGSGQIILFYFCKMEKCLFTGMYMRVMIKKKEREERLPSECPVTTHPPTHSLPSVWRWHIVSPLPPQRRFGRSRTLPAQKQQITALRTTVQKLHYCRHHLSPYSWYNALICPFLWTRSHSGGNTKQFTQSARIRHQNPWWCSLSHFYYDSVPALE